MFFKALLILLIISSSNILIHGDNLKESKYTMLEHHLKNRGISSSRVLNAMENVPREEFVLTNDRNHAYDDRPLAIGFGQTISQPFIVAYMTELLKVSKDSKVLEIGTGSGYQAAVLAEIVESVYTIEIVEGLYKRATKTLKELKYKNITTKWGDGYFGLEDFAPYDAIIVTCAAKSIPPNLIKQLKIGGIICIPVGPPFSIQVLYLITKVAEDDIRAEAIDYVRFVPLTREKKK